MSDEAKDGARAETIRLRDNIEQAVREFTIHQNRLMDRRDAEPETVHVVRWVLVADVLDASEARAVSVHTAAGCATWEAAGMLWHVLHSGLLQVH